MLMLVKDKLITEGMLCCILFSCDMSDQFGIFYFNKNFSLFVLIFIFH